MEFLNKKESVLDIQLTQYGKYLLSIGKLHPVYYSFGDDGVLYDALYAGISTEGQNNNQTRIKEIPSMASQTNTHGVESNIKLEANLLSQKFLQNNLGTIDVHSSAMPAWEISVLAGELTSSVRHKVDHLGTRNIPQLNFKDAEFKIYVRQDQPPEDIGNSVLQEGNSNDVGTASDLNLFLDKFEDGSYVEIFENEIMIEVLEENTDISNEKFIVEVFKIESENKGNNNTIEILKPLRFANIKKNLVQNGILLDNIQQEDVEITSQNVEYFLDILFDEDISEKEIIARQNTQNLYETDVTEEKLRNC